MKKKKKMQWQQLLFLLVFMVAGGICGMMLALTMNKLGIDLLTAQGLPVFAGLLLGVMVGIYVQLIIHEAGHLVFGLLSGYRFSSFRIGSFMWLRENGKLVLRKLTIAGTGGQCLMVPPEPVDGRIPVVLYNLGGSLMNLLVSAVLFLLWELLPGAHAAAILLLTTALLGVVVALMNGIPLRMGTVDNDGYNALSLGKSEDAMRAFWLQLKINDQTARGIRLKDMPDEWFVVPADAAMQNSMVAAVGVFACNRLMDQQQFAAADRLMAHLLQLDSGIIGLHRNLMLCDRIFCELIGENRPDILEKYLSKEQKTFMKSMKKFPSVVRTEYALALLAKRDEAGAAAARRLFEKVAKTYPYASDIQMERELIEAAAAKRQAGTE